MGLQSDREGAFSTSVAYSSEIGKREASNLTDSVPHLLDLYVADGKKASNLTERVPSP